MGRRVPGDPPAQGGIWSIITTTGGAGDRGLRPLLKGERPKVLCRFTGRRTVLEHTLARADLVSPPAHSIVVVSESEDPGVLDHLGRSGRAWVRQPSGRGTAAGILLALAHLRHLAPDAAVVIYPSDHFIYPEHRFAHWIRRALEAGALLGDRLFLMGVAPDRFDAGYAWLDLEAGGEDYGSPQIRTIRTYLDRPGLTEAHAALNGRALWSTGVLVGRLEAFWGVGKTCFRCALDRAEELARSADPPRRGSRLEAARHGLRRMDFLDVALRRAPGSVLAFEAPGVVWSDWATPDRIRASLSRIGREPAFPAEYLRRPLQDEATLPAFPLVPPWMRTLSSLVGRAG